MKLSANDIDVLSREVAALCAGAQVQRIRDGRPGEVLIDMRAPGRTLRLLIAAGSTSARLHLVDRKEVVRSSKGQPPTVFVQLLRKHLMGSRLVGAEAVPADRVSKITFARRGVPDDPEAPPASTSLLAELTGRHGNLFLLDAAAVILGSMRANVSHRRKLVTGEPYIYPSLPSSRAPEVETQLDASLTGRASRYVDESFERRLDETELTAKRVDIQRGVRRGIKRVERRLRKIERDLQRAEDADQLLRWGELLQSAYGQVERGASSAVVPDFYDPEQAPVTIPLNPAASLAQNIQHYFKEAKRLKAARRLIAKRRDQTRAELQLLADAKNTISTASTADELEAIDEQLRRQRLLPKRQSPPTRSSRSTKRGAIALPYHQFVSSTGKAILVGRGARQNDQLTFRVGRGRDLWLHVDGSAGAHVIVRLDKGQSVDGDTLVEAAMLAVHYSDERRNTSAEVRYTLQRNVRKPKGAAPGLVLVAQAKAIAVRVEPETLQRLFERKQDAQHA